MTGRAVRGRDLAVLDAEGVQMQTSERDEMVVWYEAGACRGVDPDLFFPERGHSCAEAKAVCATCPSIEPCRDWGLRHEHFGIWGGLAERERRIIRRKLGIECHSIFTDAEELITRRVKLGSARAA
ncbi:MAG: WhiB family transcriptional regulator [Actinobacteria bacterium]|jgi:WhiB family redox-sensing transcriptional regulator|nr:WhiB family transcriptional regulator [Actinomycetota bacterium]